MARDLLSISHMRSESPSLDLVELRRLIGGAASETRRASVAFAMQSLQNNGTVANWVIRTASAKHGLVNCSCGCGLPNCR